MQPFGDILAAMNGDLYEEAGAKLQDLVTAVMESRKAGTFQLTLKIKPNGERMVEIIPDLKVKAPEASPPNTMFFASSGGTLLRDDPAQPRLPLREVEQRKQDLKEMV
jgi:hypothetical protein